MPQTFNPDEQILKHLKGLRIPPIPSILHTLNMEMQKDYPDVRVIKSAIQKDISISSLMLKTINSSFFGLKIKVSSISVAINMLGLSNTINIVMGVVLAMAFKEQEEASINYWESPSNIALVSSALAKKFTQVPADDAYVLGLFHNAGHMLMAQKYDDYNQFFDSHINLPEFPITTYEDKKYNTEHALLGFYLASAWGLPHYITQVILQHHGGSSYIAYGTKNIDEDRYGYLVNNLLCVLKMAEHIDKRYWSDDEDHEWNRVKDDVLGYFGLSDEDFNDVRDDMLEQLELKD